MPAQAGIHDFSWSHVMERITIAEFHTRLKSQGVSNQRDSAFVCVICGTVQSMNSLVRAGAKPDEAERIIGFSCEGRLTNAGPWPRASDESEQVIKRRAIRGCDWTLGGLFTLHKLEIIDEEGKKHPRFELATPEQAIALARSLESERFP